MRGKEKFGAKCIELKKGGHGFMIFDSWWVTRMAFSKQPLFWDFIITNNPYKVL